MPGTGPVAEHPTAFMIVLRAATRGYALAARRRWLITVVMPSPRIDTP